MFKGLHFFVKFSWKHRKSYLILNIINQIVSGVLPLIIIAMPKFIIDELIGEQRYSALLIYIGVLLISIFVNNWVSAHIGLLIFNQRCYLATAFGEYMHEKLANTDFANLESPEFYDIKEKANKFLYGDWHGFSYVLESALSIVGKLFTLIGIIVILSSMNIWLLLLFIAMILIGALIDYRAKKKAHTFSLDAVEIERRWSYFTRILDDAAYAKEIRQIKSISG